VDLVIAFFKSLFISIPVMMVWVAIRIKWNEWRESR